MKVLFKIVVMILLFANLIYLHEQIHASICRHSGGIPEITYGIKYATTTCKVSFQNENDLEYFRKYNTINELVGYYLQVILMFITIYVVLKEDKK
jgi:hypothetical protein